MAIAAALAHSEGRRLAMIPVAGVLIYTTASLTAQVAIWTEACRLSRSVMQQVEPYRGRDDVALRIANMPFMFVEGPFVLKAYAFRFYGNDRRPPLPPINARAWTIQYSAQNRPIASAGIDVSSDYLDRPPDGLIELPVQLVLEPENRQPAVAGLR